MSRLTLLFILSFFASSPTIAAYRVYKLKVEFFDVEGRVDKTVSVLSTLDPRQYEHYHGGYRNSKVSFEDTWYCPGDTGHHRQYCDPPTIAGESKPAKQGALPPQRAPSSVKIAKPSPPPALPYNRQPVIP